MEKQQVVEQFSMHGVKVLRIIKIYGTFRVTIDWRDYLKIRDIADLMKYDIVQRK